MVAKSELEKLAGDIKVSIRHAPFISGETSLPTFERVFNTKLRQVKRMIHSLRKPYEVTEWSGFANVPKHLKDKIASIHLERKIYLTD